MDCILCGKCMEVCPLLRATNREELAPRAKALLGGGTGDDPSFNHVSGKDVARLATLCLGCGRCRQKCPQKADVPAIVARLRAEHPDFRSWLWKTWLTHSRELWPSTSLAAHLIPTRFQPERLGPLLKMMADVKKGPDSVPFVRVESFTRSLQDIPVMLFAGCMANHVRKHWLKTSEALIRGMGGTLLSAGFECCGGSLRMTGCFPEAAKLEEKNVAAWRNQGCPLILTPCASCLNSLRDYPENTFRSPAERAAWQKKVQPLSTYLQHSTFSLSHNAVAEYGYHRPCHLVGFDTDRALLISMFGKEPARETSRECCGFGGILRLAEPALADLPGKACAKTLSGAPIVLTGCSACAARLPSTLSETIPAGHWIDILQEIP